MLRTSAATVQSAAAPIYRDEVSTYARMLTVRKAVALSVYLAEPHAATAFLS
jgi:hypothetical protein